MSPWAKCKRIVGCGSGDDEDDAEKSKHQITVRAFESDPSVRIPETTGNNLWKVARWTNIIRTSQYRWWNFVILNLLQQVIIPSNAYFLLMAVLQMIKPVSDSGGVPTFLVPISFVFLVTMVKDAWEDSKRHRSDTAENESRCHTLRKDGTIVECKWKDLKPGDICVVYSDEQFPADLVLLTCSDPYGISYLETVQLDGETNLKDKTCLSEMVEMCPSPATVARLQIEMTCMPPDVRLYTFHGTLRLYSEKFCTSGSSPAAEVQLAPRKSLAAPDVEAAMRDASASIKFTRRVVSNVGTNGAYSGAASVELPVSVAQFLWRGTTLSNTEWAVGLVVYTGHETRILKNSRSRQLKYSSLLKMYNSHAITLACVQFSICLLAALIYASRVATDRSWWYLAAENDKGMGAAGGLAGFLTAFGIGFGRFVLLLSYFIPITLFVQLEIVKFVQSFFMTCDQRMVSEISGKGALVQTVSLVEELGCVTHVFSDKTGTLTLNLMQLRCVGTPAGLYSPSHEFKSSPAKTTAMETMSAENKELVRKYRNLPNPFAEFDSYAIGEELRCLQGDERDRTKDFLLVLSLCHSVLTKKEKKVKTLIEDGALVELASFEEEPPEGMSPRTAPRDSVQSIAQSTATPRGSAHSVELQTGSMVSTQVTLRRTAEPSPGDPYARSQQASARSQPASARSQQHSRRSDQLSPGQGRDSALSNVPPLLMNDSVGATTASPATVTDQFRPAALDEVFQDPNRMEHQPSAFHKTSAKSDVGSSSSSEPNMIPASLLIADIFSDSEEERRFATFSSDVKHLAETAASTARVGAIAWARATSVQFDASSPDELALLSGAMHLGLEFIRRPNLASIEIALTTNMARDYLLDTPALKAQAKAVREACGAARFGDYFFPNPDDPDWLEAAEAHQAAVQRVEQAATEAMRIGEDTTKARLASDSGQILVPVPTLRFDVLEVLDFDNVRKKMSVIVRDLEGKTRLLTKGADSHMIASAKSEDPYLIDLTAALDEMSHRGLRTLVFGWRYLTDEDLRQFREELNAVRATGDEEKAIRLFDQLESNLTLCGCTGIDDKLQPEVPDTIEALRHAGIKLWVLTGDKLETAVSIGNSCNVLTPFTYNAIVDGNSEEKVREQLHQYMAFIVAGQLAKQAFDAMLQTQSPDVDENSEDGPNNAYGCSRFVRTVGYPFGCLRPPKASTGAKKQTGPLSMSWDDFVRAITFQAKAQRVMSEPAQSTPAPLTPTQVDILIQEYLRAFDANSQNTASRGKRKKAEVVKAPPPQFSQDAQHAAPPLSVPSLKQFGHYEELVDPVAPQPDGTFADDISFAVSRPIREASWDWQAFPRDSTRKDTSSPLQSSPCSTVDEQLPEAKQTFGTVPTHGAEKRSGDREVEQFNAVAITCTGEALGYVLGNENVRRYFFGLANLCATVIACRVTPKQKAEVVRQSAAYLKGTVSLGVGDGANDVGMIITADVGVGISGKEGMQAVRAADFAIGEFRLLRNLLFLHGHENLRRNALQVYHTMFKNVMYGVADWYFGFWSRFSAVDIYSTWLKQIYNLLYTSCPPVIVSVFDRVLPADIFLACPWLYPSCLPEGKSRYFGKRRFWNWLLYGLASSFMIVWMPLYTTGVVHSSGRLGIDSHTYGHTVFFLIVIVSNFALCPFINTWFWFLVGAYILSFSIWYLSWYICSCGFWLCAELTGTMSRSDSSGSWHLTVLFVAFLVLGVSICVWYYSSVFAPSDATIIRERIARGVFDVVVAPRAVGGLTVVVPRREGDEHWRGFAFSEATTRFQMHRRLSQIPRAVVAQTAALGTAAGGLIYGGGPAAAKMSSTSAPEEK